MSNWIKDNARKETKTEFYLIKSMYEYTYVGGIIAGLVIIKKYEEDVKLCVIYKM